MTTTTTILTVGGLATSICEVAARAMTPTQRLVGETPVKLMAKLELLEAMADSAWLNQMSELEATRLEHAGKRLAEAMDALNAEQEAAA